MAASSSRTRTAGRRGGGAEISATSSTSTTMLGLTGYYWAYLISGPQRSLLFKIAIP
jgi:hypothetical protein